MYLTANTPHMNFIHTLLSKSLCLLLILQIVTSWPTVCRWRTGSVPQSSDTVLITAAVVDLMYKIQWQKYPCVIVFSANFAWK